MAVGFRVYTKIKRTDKAVVESFRGIPVANIGDQMGRISCIDTGIRPFAKGGILGVAVTVKVPPGDNLMIHKAIDMAEPGDVIVIDGEGCMNHSLGGDILYTYAKKKGIAGFIVDGCIRDIDAIEELNFPVYARGVNPNGPYKNGPGEVNVPVSIGGIVVTPGDVVCGDSDGVVIVKQADAAEVAVLGKKHAESEAEIFENIKKGTLNRDWVEKTIVNNGGEIIDDYYQG